MTGEDLTDDSHMVRYARPTLIREDGSVGGEAFQLRPEESSLSVNWLECFKEFSKSQQLDEVRRRSRLQMRGNGRLAELQVGHTKQYVHAEFNNLRFVHQPLAAEEEYEADPSHSEIVGLPQADSPEAELIGDLIAECVTAVYLAVEES